MVLGIYGASGLGREVLELAKIINSRQKIWEDFIFIDDGDVGDEVNGVKIYFYADAIRKFSGNLEISMGIGEPSIRERLFQKLETDGINAATLIHPDVYIPDTTKIGKGVTIQFGSFISCNAIIHDYVFIQPRTSIAHDCELGCGTIISTECALSGAVKTGNYTYFGVGTVVKEGVSIGNYTVIGMGSVVYNDISDEMIVLGNPAKPVRANEERRVFK